MKSILNAFYSFLHEFGKARAATAMARRGDYSTARAIMEAK
jgi:hypothetical protein